MAAATARVSALASGLGGAQGGVLGAICVMPLEMVVAKRASGDGRSTVQILAAAVKRDGFFGGLWSFRVMPWKCMYAFLNRGLMYGSYAWISALAARRTGGRSAGVFGAAVLAWAADLAVRQHAVVLGRCRCTPWPILPRAGARVREKEDESGHDWALPPPSSVAHHAVAHHPAAALTWCVRRSSRWCTR